MILNYIQIALLNFRRQKTYTLLNVVGLSLAMAASLPIIIACPLGWWLMSEWLQSFPYKTSIDLWTFAASGALVLVVAFISVSSQTLGAALTKPAETLKYE